MKLLKLTLAYMYLSLQQKHYSCFLNCQISTITSHKSSIIDFDGSMDCEPSYMYSVQEKNWAGKAMGTVTFQTSCFKATRVTAVKIIQRSKINQSILLQYLSILVGLKQ